MSDETRMTLLHHSTNDLVEELLMWRGLAAEHLARIAELEEAQRWIPVGERLPKENQPVLVLTRLGGFYVDFIDGESLVTGTLDFEDVTHWMPLPEPPEVQE